MTQAKKLRSPFSMDAPVDDDLWFAARCIAVFGPHIKRYRNEQSKAFWRVCRGLVGLNVQLVQAMHPDVARVASAKSPAAMAVITVIMRWPDREQPCLFVSGFPMIGQAETSQVFRTLQTPVGGGEEAIQDFLGPAASQWVDELEAMTPRWDDVDYIYQQTIKEQKAGYCGPFLSKSGLDEKYGVGGWRPQKRFLITQAGGKKRVIDDAHRSGHNAATRTWETIFTVNCEFAVFAARTLIREILRTEASDCDLEGNLGHLLSLIPAWVDVVQFLQDMVDAYRQVPSAPEHASVMQIAVYVPSLGWRYTQMYGNPFGMSRAVLNFNRLPTLNVAFCRRSMGVMAAAYFDDNLGVDLAIADGTGEAAMVAVFTELGATLSPSKAMAPASRRVFLGADIDVGQASRQGVCTIRLKENAKEDMSTMMDDIVTSGVFSSGMASKLRGLLGWACTGIHGKCGRGGQAAFMERQYQEPGHTEIEEKHLEAFNYHRLLLAIVPPRHLRILGAQGPPLIVYSDAFFKPYDEPPPPDGIRCRMGWVIFDPASDALPVGGTMFIDDAMLLKWKPRNQQVFIAETLAVLAASLEHKELFRGRDVIWFVDNIGALQVLIKGNSSQFDAGNVCAAAHLYWASMGTRVWFEWVASDDNPSDGLSRDGLHDEWTLAQRPQWTIAEYLAPLWFSLIELPIEQMRQLYIQ